MDALPNVSDWSQIVNVIREMMADSPGMGILVIILSLLVVTFLITISTWAVIKIIRARKAPHMDSILSLVRVLTSMMSERDRLSRRHEHIRENSLIRDQMTVVEGTMEDVEKHLLIQISRTLTDLEPDGSEVNITNSSNYLQAKDSLSLVFKDIHVQFRRAIKENHIDEKTEIEFFDYVADKVARLRTIMLQYINVRSTTISTDKLLTDTLEKNWLYIDPMVRKMYQNIRQLKIKYATLIQEEEMLFDSQWNEFMNKVPEILTKGQAQPELEVLDAVSD